MYKLFGILVLILIIGIIKLFITGHPGLGILAILALASQFFCLLFVSEVLSIILLIFLAIVVFVK